MSIRTMTTVWDSGCYDGGALLVLLAMADYADEEHICRPSVGALARKARLSERQIIRILNHLKTDGAIVPIGEHKSKQGRPIVIYRINTDALKGDICDSLKVTPMSPLETPKGDIYALKGDICDSPKVTPMSPLETPKGDICAPKGDICDSLKVTPMSYDPPIDPPIDPSLEEGGAASPPPPPPPPPPAPARTKTQGKTPKPQPAPVREENPSPPVAPPPPSTTATPTTKMMADQAVIAAYREIFLRTPSKAQMALILAHQINDLNRWRRVLTLWCGRGWNLSNVAGMLDLYDHPERIDNEHTYQSRLPAIRAANGAGHRAAPNQRPPWADYVESEFDPIWAAELNGDDPADYLISSA